MRAVVGRRQPAGTPCVARVLANSPELLVLNLLDDGDLSERETPKHSKSPGARDKNKRDPPTPECPFGCRPSWQFSDTYGRATAVAAVMWFVLRLMPRVDAAIGKPCGGPCWRLRRAYAFRRFLSPGVQAGLGPCGPKRKSERAPCPPQLSTSRLASAFVPAQPVSSAPLAELKPRCGASRADSHKFGLANGRRGLLFLWIAACLCPTQQNRARLLASSRPAASAPGPPPGVAVRFEQRLRDSRTSGQGLSDEVISPLAAGFLQPVVILPQTLRTEIAEPNSTTCVHELAHVARRDDWTNLIGRLASAVLAFHPVALWACAASSERGRSPVTIGLSPPPAPPFTTPLLSGTWLNSTQRAVANCWRLKWLTNLPTSASVLRCCFVPGSHTGASLPRVSFARGRARSSG